MTVILVVLEGVILIGSESDTDRQWECYRQAMGVILTAAHCQQLSSPVPPQARLEVPAKLPPPYPAEYCPAAQVALSPAHPELSASAGGVRDDRSIDFCSITCTAATCGVLVTDAPGTSCFGLV